MITITGKQTLANVMIDDVDAATEDQIRVATDHPAFRGSYIAVMPDCHVGSGVVIGFTAKMMKHIIPAVVGVDIGCGVMACHLGQVDVDLREFDIAIRKAVPTGFNVRERTGMAMPNVSSRVAKWAEIIGMDCEKAELSLGTLGGGNHYIELGRDSADNLWATVHTGSRNFGLRLAQHFQSVAKQRMADYFIADQYKGLEFLLVDSPEGQAYLEGVRVAQLYAAVNRVLILDAVSELIGCESTDRIDSVHNFIDATGMIRKGATPAHAGQRLLIPLNMRDGTLLCKGKGSAKFNYSAPHGAGRLLSRRAAKNSLSVSDFVASMKEAGVYSTSVGVDTLDEAPQAYKDKQVIIDNIAETVDVLDVIKPIYNLKASEGS